MCVCVLIMNFHLCLHRKLSDVIPVPDGLPELMSDITREVLRYQPENIETFIADYLEAMVMTRELYHVAERTVEDVLNSSLEVKQLLEQSGLSITQVESTIEVIKNECRNHISAVQETDALNELDIANRLVSDCHLSVDQARKVSEIIENSWSRCYEQNRCQMLKINPNFSHNIAVKNTLANYAKSGATSKEFRQIDGYKPFKIRKNCKKTEIKPLAADPKAFWRSPNFQNREEAAIKIQAWFRGTKAKNDFKDQVKAALIIQAGFKGYKNRKELKKQQSSSSDGSTHVKLHELCKNKNNWNVPCFQAREKATELIQSWYRTKKLRQHFNIQRKAATTIQAHFRGFKTRKSVMDKVKGDN